MKVQKKIQDYYRNKKKSRKERDKIILKKKLEAEKEKYSYIDVDKFVDNVIKNKNEEEVHKLISSIGKTNEKNENNKISDVNNNDEGDNSNVNKHHVNTNGNGKDNAIGGGNAVSGGNAGSRGKASSGDGNANSGVNGSSGVKGSSVGVDEKIKDKKDKKNIKVINNKKGKGHKINATKELINETDKDKIIDLLLYSHLPYDEKVYRKRLKRSKSDYYKIEDKLLHEGEQMKKNKEKRILESVEKENAKQNYDFNPKILKSSLIKTKKYPNDFLKRMEYYQLFKKRNLENLRNKVFLDKINDLRFEPQINIAPYKNIQSKVYNNSNFGKTKKENTNNENNGENAKVNEEENENGKINEKEKEKQNENYLTVQQKLNKNNLSKLNNTYNNKYIGDYKTEDIWPKDLIQKYLDDTQNFENCKNDN